MIPIKYLIFNRSLLSQNIFHMYIQHLSNNIDRFRMTLKFEIIVELWYTYFYLVLDI